MSRSWISISSIFHHATTTFFKIFSHILRELCTECCTFNKYASWSFKEFYNFPLTDQLSIFRSCSIILFYVVVLQHVFLCNYLNHMKPYSYKKSMTKFRHDHLNNKFFHFKFLLLMSLILRSRDDFMFNYGMTIIWLRKTLYSHNNLSKYISMKFCSLRWQAYFADFNLQLLDFYSMCFNILPEILLHNIQLY